MYCGRNTLQAVVLLLAAIVALAGCGLTESASSTSPAIADAPAPATSSSPAEESPPGDGDLAPSRSEESSPEDVSPADTATAERGSSLAVLATLKVKGRAAKTGYDRAQFGPAWLDADRNGCDTRNDILRRDLSDVTIKSGTQGCVVLTGVLVDDYTSKRIEHVRGNSTIDIDHRVALSHAWQTGAAKWTLAKRAAFANDPLNLIATDAGANRSKGDGDAATWLPPNKAYRCDYVATQVAVKAKYELWVTAAERDAITRVLGDCPGHQLPTDPTNAPTEVDHNLKPVASPKPKGAEAKPKPSPKPTRAPVTVFKNCTEARAAGAAPVYRDDPGYGRHLDRDGDGVGCE